MTKHLHAALVLLPFMFACGGSGPTAADVCKKVEASGIAKGCREDKPGGLGAASDSTWVADLVEVPGKTVQVMHFPNADTYAATVKSFEGAAVLAGPHRYGNEKGRIFVQANSGLSLEGGKKLKGVVDAL